MLSFLADENFSLPVVQGSRHKLPSIDIVRVQEVGLISADDPTLLDWAEQHGRILLTHDIQTMTKFAYDRVKAGLPMPGVIEVKQSAPVGRVIEQLLLIAEYTDPDEWKDQVSFLPT